LLHVDVVQIWITVIKWLENHLNVFKRSNDPWNFPNFQMTVVLVHVNCRNFLKAIRGSYRPFVIKHALFPLGTTSLLVSCSGLWGVCVQTFVKHANFFTTSSWWHDITSSKVSCVSDLFFTFWNLNAMALHALCHSRETNMFENSCQFTAHGINSHTSTQIWFFKPLWLAIACRCSSNLNYGH
jgi:hypothetical protein